MLCFPDGTRLRQDTGYQGFAPKGVTLFQPRKKTRGQELSTQDKERNRNIAKERIVVEHCISGIKRLRILKEKIRHRLYDFRDTVMNIGCAMHNFRVESRSKPAPSYAHAHT